jgi:Domain of unknown function (DUF4406)
MTEQVAGRRRLYVAGPMSGYPGFNYPAFRRATAALRAAGYAVECPAENPEQSCWEDYLRLGLGQVLAVDGVATLPDWRESRGAALEVHVAHALGLPVLPVDRWLSLL